MYDVQLTKRAFKDYAKLKQAGILKKAGELINILKQNPFQAPPPYEKLVGDLQGYYSRRINVQHRLVYSVDKDAQIVVIRSMWTHYE
ncbi:addiction module toxin [Christensenella minuta]|nr:Txe/YoeB family addiction module toxin [Christensenella minuta]AYH41293.1 Txe/YoeB family addiction module toxin [Christensenella minuta]AYH41328.1 Txe/YoeB family addiction module toxin [Christensenella minuta]OAQ39348.1 addiction module toxin [Christensenella minuta]